MGNACFAPEDEAADDEAADDEAEPPEQEDFVTLTGGAKRGTFHVGAEAVRRDGGEVEQVASRHRERGSGEAVAASRPLVEVELLSRAS